MGRQTADMVRRFAARERPFLIYANLLEPHMPFTGPLNHLYDPAEVPTGPAFLEPPPGNAALVNRMLAEYFLNSEWEGHDLRTEAGWRPHPGELPGAGDAGGQRRGGDPAGAGGERRLGGDGRGVHFGPRGHDGRPRHPGQAVQYEEAVRVPLLVRAPWLAGQGQRVRGRFSQIDLVPTLLDLLGLPAPGGLHGRSRAGALEGDGSLEGEDVFIEWNGRHSRPGPPFTTAGEETRRILALPWRTVIGADGWKLNLNAEDRCELYHLESDPHERRNRYDEPGQRHRIRELTDRIEAWQQRTADTAVVRGPRRRLSRLSRPGRRPSRLRGPSWSRGSPR